MWLTIVLERHLLRGSNVKIRLNTPSPGFTVATRMYNFSAGIAMEEFLLGENYVLAANAIKILLSGRILVGIPEKSFSLGGILASTDFSARFLPRYAVGIFPGKDAAGKTGHLGGIPAYLGGIPVNAGNLGGIPARSRYLFYKG